MVATLRGPAPNHVRNSCTAWERHATKVDWVLIIMAGSERSGE